MAHSPLYYAISYGKHKVVQKLIDNNLHSNISSYLFLACKSYSIETIKLVLKYGANENINHAVTPFEVFLFLFGFFFYYILIFFIYRVLFILLLKRINWNS